MYEEYKRYVDNLFDDLEWGVLINEVMAYLNKKHHAGLVASPKDPKVKRAYIGVSNYTRKYSFKKWGELHPALLQHAGGSVFGGKGGAARHIFKLKLKDPHLNNSSPILATKLKYAWSRLFFEIEEDIEELMGKGLVFEKCGYMVIKTLYLSEGALDIKSLMDKMGYADTCKRYSKKSFTKGRIEPLRKLAMLEVKDDEIQLAPVIRDAYKHMHLTFLDIKKWKYRGKGGWILPIYK